MNRGVLLVLLCLQAFLLITVFTPTDAAALVKNDQQQKSLDLEKEIGKLIIRTKRNIGAYGRRADKEIRKLIILTKRGCWGNPGGCGRRAKEEIGKLTIRTKGRCRRRPNACGRRADKEIRKLLILTKRDCGGPGMSGSCSGYQKHLQEIKLHLKEKKSMST